MTILDIGGKRVQVDDSFLSLSPEDQNAAVQQIAGGLMQGPPRPDTLPQPSQPEPTPEAPFSATPEPESPGFFQRLGTAAEGMLNDINSAFQRVNPVGMQEALGTGQVVGVLKPIAPGSDQMVVDVDGVLEPASKYPADQFATVRQGGMTYVIPRSATDSAGKGVEASRAESAGRALGWGLPTGIQGAARGPSKATQAAQDAEAAGVTPSFAMRGTTRGKIAAAGEQFAPTAGAFRKDAQRVTDEIGAAAKGLADRAGSGVTPFEAGEALQRGGEAYVKGVRDFQSQLYGAVDTAIAADTPVQATATMAALAREGDKLRKLPNTISADRLAALEAGTMTWEQARALRTDIGTAMRSFDGAETNVAKGQLDQIYKALSEDLDATVQAAGPEAAQAWTRANKYKRVSEERITSAFSKLLGDKVTPEAAYTRLTAMAAEGGGGANISSLRRVFQSLPKDERATVAGTIIRRLGRATAGAQDATGEAFSADTFLTNWNKMSPAARSTIASSGLDKGVEDGLTTLARVIERAKEAGTFRNHSNTGNVVTGAALGSGAIAAPVSTIATAIGSWSAAQLVTMPKLLHAVNRLAATGKTDALNALAAAGGPGAIEAQTILRLQAPQGSSSPQSQPTAPGAGIGSAGSGWR